VDITSSSLEGSSFLLSCILSHSVQVRYYYYLEKRNHNSVLRGSFSVAPLSPQTDIHAGMYLRFGVVDRLLAWDT
jgi:hypothetical protein